MEQALPNVSGQTEPPTLRRRTTGFGDLSEQLEYWRTHLNEYKHPVLLFDGNIWPVLLNDTLQQLIQDRTPIDGTDETVSSIWKSNCEKAAEIVTKYLRSSAASEVAEVFTLHQRCFVVVGSLLKTTSGRVVGAVANLAEISPGSANTAHVFGQHVAQQQASDVSRETASTAELEFHQWCTVREQAREKIAALSRRESQVLAFVADGQSNKQIASELGVTTKTIEKHRANAGLKLGANSSAEMVRISVTAGHEIPPTFTPTSN